VLLNPFKRIGFPRLFPAEVPSRFKLSEEAEGLLVL